MNDIVFTLYFATASVIIGISLYSLIIDPRFFRKILAFNIMGSAIFIIYGTIARRNWEGMADPVPQAMVITGIVVSVSATAFALVLLGRIHQLSRRAGLSPEETDI